MNMKEQFGHLSGIPGFIRCIDENEEKLKVDSIDEETLEKIRFDIFVSL